MKRLIALIILTAVLLVAAGCTNGTPATPPAVAFLQKHNVAFEGEGERFRVTIPASWEVPLGAYPEGLYWGLVNEFSKDLGLDLTRHKGKDATVWRYDVKGGLRSEDPRMSALYPSRVVVLVRDGAVVGAWYNFNVWGFGPSLKNRHLEEITGLPFERWVEREGFFQDPGKNGDLATLGPVEVLGTFFDAIRDGDKTRASACLTPRALRDTLTMNLGERMLYHAGFNDQNSMVENIRHGKLLAAKLVDPDRPAEPIGEIGDRTRVEIVAGVELRWRMSEFNTPSGTATRFAIMEKTARGWKMSGLGTGP